MKNLTRQLSRSGQRSAWLIFGLSLLLVSLASHGLYRQARNDNEQKFNLYVGDVLDAIRERLRRHEQILLGGAGLFDASDNQVSREAWRSYVGRLKLERNYPGIQGVGYSQLIQPKDLSRHTQAIRSEGFAQYSVRPPGQRPLYTSIIYLEPFRDRNLAAFGYDMFSQSTRQEAMRRAGESGVTSITGKVRLVQETHGKEQAGFLMYVPIYRKGMPLGTSQERWHALQGFVYSPYRVDDLMHGVMGESLTPLDFEIFDGKDEVGEALMYNSTDAVGGRVADPAHHPQYKVSHQIEAYGRLWQVRFTSRPDIETAWLSQQTGMLLASGAGFSFTLLLFVSFLNTRRERAETMAAAMTAEIRRNEQQLRVNDARLNEAQRTAHIGNWELDMASGRLIWSDEIYRLFGIDGERCEASYDAFLKVVHPDDREAVDQAYRVSLQNREPYEIKHRLLMADGQVKWVQEKCMTDFDAEGRPTISRGTVQDITQLTQAERQAQESAEFAKSILDNAVDGIISINEKGVVQSFNKAGESIFGYLAEEVIGRNVNMLMPQPYRDEHDNYLGNYRKTGVPKVIGKGREVTGLRKDGSTFPMDLAVSRSQRQGEPLFVGLVRDITERKRVEQMKAEFVSTVSHELRTPLTSITGALGLVCGGALGEVSGQAKNMLDIAYKNSQRLTHLINDLLDMEKLVAGKMRFEMQTQEIMPLVEQAIEGMRGYAQQYQVSIVLKERADGARVRIDASRLLQVLNNFLSNAAKFSSPGSPVAVVVRREGANVRVEVVDRGVGVPEGFRQRMFQKFSQADSSDARQKGGTGLGLAISKELVEQMNGVIGFESKSGQGASFYFVLPVAAASEAMPEILGEELPGVPRVLVVEDDPDIAELLVLMLTRAGYGADAAGSAESALQMLDKRDYVAITLDLLLPDQSGMSLIRTLRARPKFERLPVIVISAFVEDGKLAIGEEFPALDWLDKPIDEGRLISVVRNVLLTPQHRRPRVLHVEDDPDFVHIVATLGQEVADFDSARTLAQAKELLAQAHYDLVILDLGLPDGSGFLLMPQIRKLKPMPQVVVLSGREVQLKQLDVDQVLVKSRTSTESLLATIRQMLNQASFQAETMGDMS